MPKSSSPRTRYTAAKADRHVLYQMAVQNVEAEIDFVDDTLGGGFKIENPKVKAACGCGESFAI